MIGEYLAMTVYDAMFSRWCQIDVAALATLNRRFTSGACLHKPMGRSMLSAERKPFAEATRLVRLTLPVQVDAALERIAKIGFSGRSESEVVVILL
ncbi:Uncharacterised protein [Burkholderia pseudomallei]|nr:Uncharacterised protein [Burkholderia pseudomallei]